MKKNRPTGKSLNPAVDRAILLEFHSIADHWLKTSCELFPEHGSKLGFHKYDGLLSENTPAVHLQNIALIEETLRRVEALPEAAFAGDDWLDRRGLIARLRMDLLFDRDLARWRTNPQIHCNCAADAIFELVVRGAEKLSKVIPAIESRLSRIPDYLAAATECIKLPDPLWVSLTEKSCEGSIEFLQELELELSRFSKNQKKIPSLLRGAESAFADYAKAVRRKRPAPEGSFSIGRDRFEFLIREQLGLDLSLPEARAAGEHEVARHEFLLREAAKKHGRKSAREFIDQAAAKWTPKESLLGVYRTTTADIKTKLKKLNLVTLPEGDELKVLPVPAFLKHQFPTAAYSAPEPFSRKQTGIFWVNDLSLDVHEPAQKLAEIRQHHGLELTSVHEAYPGHHLQFVIQFRHSSRLRRLFSHSIFYEGWTMWCEKTAVSEKLVTIPGAELIQLHDALWRAHRIVIDCGLHDGSLTHATAAKRLQDGVQFTAARAAADVNWYTSSPTVPMSYLLGRLEVEKLHRHLVENEGWSLRKFNDWMLSHGAIPYSWIWRASLAR